MKRYGMLRTVDRWRGGGDEDDAILSRRKLSFPIGVLFRNNQVMTTKHVPSSRNLVVIFLRARSSAPKKHLQ